MGTVFPMRKYELLPEQLPDEGSYSSSGFIKPPLGSNGFIFNPNIMDDYEIAIPLIISGLMPYTHGPGFHYRIP
jgi:hypothetical protein